MQTRAHFGEGDSYESHWHADEVVHTRWGWFVALGVAYLVLAALAFGNMLIATLASVVFIGSLMIVGALVEIVHAFQVKRWGGFFLWLLAGLLYGLAGVFAFMNPLLAAATLTLVLACALIASGIMRIMLSFREKPHSGWGWVLASGLVTLLAGIVFLIGWPANTLWLLGMVLAIDLAFQGAALIGFGFAIKSPRLEHA